MVSDNSYIKIVHGNVKCYAHMKIDSPYSHMIKFYEFNVINVTTKLQE